MTPKPAVPRPRSVSQVAAAALSCGLLALAGCGGSSSTPSSSAATPSSPAATPPTSTASSTPAPGAGEGQALSLTADAGGQLKYDKTSLTAKAGAISIAFTNLAPLGHNVTVASSSGEVLGATPSFQGGSKTLSLTLKPGTYKFYCTIPGHRAGGMEGALTIK